VTLSLEVAKLGPPVPPFFTALSIESDPIGLRAEAPPVGALAEREEAGTALPATNRGCRKSRAMAVHNLLRSN